MFHHVAVIGVGGEYGFRPLSWGLFFNDLRKLIIKANYADSFRPLSWGLFFNTHGGLPTVGNDLGFRPLSWGLSFNYAILIFNKTDFAFSSPFLGTFFQ